MVPYQHKCTVEGPLVHLKAVVLPLMAVLLSANGPARVYSGYYYRHFPVRDYESLFTEPIQLFTLSTL